MPEDSKGDLTIRELAQRAGISVARYYQLRQVGRTPQTYKQCKDWREPVKAGERKCRVMVPWHEAERWLRVRYGIELN